jgi:hypothetical protein
MVSCGGAAGTTAIVQPGGSVRDDEVIAAADERGLAMVFTGGATSGISNEPGAMIVGRRALAIID